MCEKYLTGGGVIPRLRNVIPLVFLSLLPNANLWASNESLTESEAWMVTQQTKKVTGTIIDASGTPIIGANVMVKGTTSGTITDINGHFSLDVSENSLLEVSYIGYITQSIRVGSQKELSITLKEDSKALEEVVVVGYGTQKKRKLNRFCRIS